MLERGWRKAAAATEPSPLRVLLLPSPFIGRDMQVVKWTREPLEASWDMLLYSLVVIIGNHGQTKTMTSCKQSSQFMSIQLLIHKL